MKGVKTKIDAKKLTRAATAVAALLCIGMLVLTAWFIFKTLGDVAVVQESSSRNDFRIEGINLPLLEKLLGAKAEKTSADRALAPDLPNPFKKPPPEAPPAPPPAPAPETPPAPPPAPPST